MSYISVGIGYHHFRMLLEQFFFYIIFYYSYREISFVKKVCFPMFLLVPTYFIQIHFDGFGEILPMFVYYIALKRKEANNYVLLNALLISSIFPYLFYTLISARVIKAFLLYRLATISYVLVEVAIELALILIVLYCSKYIRYRWVLYQYSSLFSTLLLVFYYFSLQMLLYIADYFEVYEKFIQGIALFLVMQVIFLAVFLVREVKNQRENFKNAAIEKRISDFKEYTAQLEKNQQELRKFKHDYKNLIISLKDLAYENSPEIFKKRIKVLEDYSDSYFDSINWDYNDMGNLKNTYIKSLIISKTYLMKKHNADFYFECIKTVNTVPIEIFDLIRILGISLDNAIEAASEVAQPTISMAIFQDKYQLEFIIKNTCLETSSTISRIIAAGYSTKQGHSGFGLANIQEIKKKYDNLYVQYEKRKDQFIVHIILMFEGGE